MKVCNLLGLWYQQSSSEIDCWDTLESYSWTHQVIHVHIYAKGDPWLPVSTGCLPPALPVPSIPTHPTRLWKVRYAPRGLFSLQLWLTSTKQMMTRLSAPVLSIFFFPLTTKRFFTPFVPLPTCITHILLAFFLSLVVFIQVFGSAPFPE